MAGFDVTRAPRGGGPTGRIRHRHHRYAHRQPLLAPALRQVATSTDVTGGIPQSCSQHAVCHPHRRHQEIQKKSARQFRA
jgi:hypothetical protein